MAYVPALVELAERTMGSLDAINGAADWVDYGMDVGVKIYKRTKEGSSISMGKGVKVVEGNAKQLASRFFELKAPGKLSEWDETFILYETFDTLLEDPSFQLTVDYMTSKLPWPVWGRDFVLLNANKVEPNRVVQIQTSCLHPDRPERPKEFVRGDISLSAFIFEPADSLPLASSSRTKITRILHVEPKGLLPGWIINTQTTKQLSLIINNIETLHTSP